MVKIKTFDRNQMFPKTWTFEKQPNVSPLLIVYIFFLIYTIIISLLPLPIIEMQKWINKIRFKNNLEIPMDFNSLSRVRR